MSLFGEDSLGGKLPRGSSASSMRYPDPPPRRSPSSKTPAAIVRKNDRRHEKSPPGGLLAFSIRPAKIHLITARQVRRSGGRPCHRPHHKSAALGFLVPGGLVKKGAAGSYSSSHHCFRRDDQDPHAGDIDARGDTSRGIPGPHPLFSARVASAAGLAKKSDIDTQGGGRRPSAWLHRNSSGAS